MAHGIEGPKPSGKAYMIIRGARHVGRPYEGPFCQEAGVTPGKTYWDKQEAEDDAKKLNTADPHDMYKVVDHHLQGYFDAYPGR